MKNIAKWKPTKFALRDGRLQASDDTAYLHVSSRIAAGLIADFYNGAIPAYAKGNLLDLGCGNVPLYACYKDKVSTVTCVDWENTAHKNEFLDYTADLNQSLDFLGDARFDTIVLSDVLEHIYKPKDLLAEVSRLLRPGGHLLMNIPFYYGLHEEPFDYHRYTRHALKMMLEENGLEVREISSLGGVPEIMADLSGKQLVRIPGIGKMLCSVQNSLFAALKHLAMFRRYSARTGQRFPFSYGVVAVK